MSGLRIGHLDLDAPLLLAPIAGYCDLAFRLTVRPLGGLGLAFTALVNSRGLLRQTRRSMELVQHDPADRPLGLQLYGDESQAPDMADAARQARDHGAELVDINMGCPVDKVCKRSGGAALLRDPAAAVRLAERVARAVDLPVTAKLRLGWDEADEVAPRLARDLENAGVAAITVHGRTALQQFKGEISLDGIARVVEAVREIPVIGNGNVRRPQDARRMIEATGCAGVMIGRAGLRDPWIFRDTHALLTTGAVPPEPARAERVLVMNGHFDRLHRFKGERLACVIFRQRVTWYAPKLQVHRSFCDRMRNIGRAEEYWRLVEAYFPEVGRVIPEPAVAPSSGI